MDNEPKDIDNMQDVVWADLARIYSDRADKRPFYANKVTDSDIQRWTTSIGTSRATLFDHIALYLARGFHSSEFDFTFCDAIINDLFSVISLAHETPPDLFWQIPDTTGGRRRCPQ
jgi:hypothetical protein